MVAQWHSLAKLRIHTDHTLKFLDQFTTLLGQSLRDFLSKTCLSFNTKELPREANARQHRKTKRKTKVDQAAPATTSDNPPTQQLEVSEETHTHDTNTTAIASSSTLPSGILVSNNFPSWSVHSLKEPDHPQPEKKKGKKKTNSKHSQYQIHTTLMSLYHSYL